MNPVGYVLRRQRGKVRRRIAEPPWLTPTPVTSRNPSLVHRVNPAGNLAYMVRTMARPKPEYRLTPAERERLDRFHRDFEMNRPEDPTFQSAFLDWREAVEKYAKAKGFRVEWFLEQDPATMETIFIWKEARR